jgi:hypothetical protein
MTAAPYPLAVTWVVLETVVVGLYLTIPPMDHIATAYYFCQNKIPLKFRQIFLFTYSESTSSNQQLGTAEFVNYPVHGDGNSN